MHGFHWARCSVASQIHVRPWRLVTLTPVLGADGTQNRSFVVRSMYMRKRYWQCVALSHHTHRARQQTLTATRKSKHNSLLAHQSGPCTLKLFPPTRFFFPNRGPSLPRSFAPALITSAGPAQVKKHILANKVVSNRGGVGAAPRH